jgi:hypothetical protein
MIYHRTPVHVAELVRITEFFNSVRSAMFIDKAPLERYELRRSDMFCHSDNLGHQLISLLRSLNEKNIMPFYKHFNPNGF